MILNLILSATVFKLVYSVNLNCEIKDDPSYQSLFLEYNESLSENSFVCGFENRKNDSNELSLDIEHSLNKTNQDVEAVIYTTTSIPILPSELFKNFPMLDTCIFYNLSKTLIQRDWFKNSQSLKTLIFYHSDIPKLGGLRFSDLPNLVSLELKKCRIAYISENAFSNLMKLEKLNLSRNELKTLRFNIFKNLTSLRQLSISYNPIEKLNPTIFKNLDKLGDLDISGTLLEFIPNDIFKNNKNLRKINLQNGKISKISSKIFSHLKKLESLNLKNNSCISEHVLEQSDETLNINLLEDLLAPCSCKLARSVNPDLKLKNCLKILGVSGVVLVMLFTIKLKCKTQKKTTPETSYKFKFGK